MESFNFLESFVVTAQTGSFSAAARRLGMTPAGVGKNVKDKQAVQYVNDVIA